MDKKVQKPFMYLRNGELLYDSEGKEAMAEKQAADIIDIIKKINPNLGDANDEDVTKDEIEDTDNDSSQEIDWGAKIIDVFKNGCLKWKPSLEKDHKSLLTTKAHTNFTRKTYSEDNKIKETKVMYEEADANFNASSSGHLKISMGEKNSVKAEYDAKVNGCGEASCKGLFDKRFNDKENERELLIAKCEAKGKLEGEFKGSASFNAKENEGKADMNVKFGVHGQTSFTGVDIKLQNSNKEGRVKVLHGNAKGNAEIKAAGTFGKHKVNLEAKAKGGAKFKAMDGEFDFSAKKRNDGIYIPGFKGIVGKAKAKGEAEFCLNTEICGKKIDKKGNVSGEAEASALTLNALEVDIRKEKDDGTVRKAKASVKGMEGNFCNVEATGKRSGDITEASANLTGAKVNIGNVNATGIDNRTIHSANATSGLSADIGNVKASCLGHKGTTAGIDASLGMQMFNVSAGIARDTGVSASSKFSMFNVNLTIGTPSLNISMPGLGPNISIPFVSAGGGGGQTADQSNDSNGKGKNETGSFTGQEKENGSNNEGSLNTNRSNKEGSLNTDGNIGTKSSDGEPSQCGSIAQNNTDSCTNSRFGSKSYIGNESNTSLNYEEQSLTSLNDCIGTYDGDGGPVENGVIADDNTGRYTKDGLGSGTCIGNIREGCSNSEDTNLSSLDLNDNIESCDDDVGISETRSIAGDNMGSCTNFGYGSGSRIGNEREGCSISEDTKNKSFDLNDCIETCDEDVCFLERRSVAKDNIGSCTNTGLGSGSPIGNEREDCSISGGTNLNCIHLNDYIESCDGDVEFSESRSIAGNNMDCCTNFGFGSGSRIGNEREGCSISEGTKD
ncbi:uncharacterized protein LOC132716495 [Ruditapes philippinarum]|uniref:uncharacterized protein LOC132716495 n=1 Tax=Ruditapes philippinarum TaxID=129788 RepID=UPI00295A924D|nr:uncharacterized protein LOC132716495 [Ruditapes philippinarum]